MREILRILHGKQSGENYNILRDYNLGVCEGEIVYIQGDSGSGIASLTAVLEGSAQLDEGTIYIGERPVSHYTQNSPMEHGIYVVTEGQDLVGNLSVAENLMVLRRGGSTVRYYDKRQVRKNVGAYLSQQGLTIAADTLVRDLSEEDCQKLSIIKARMCGARLIVLDCRKGYYEGRIADELIRLIQRIRAEGVAFVILSEKLSRFADAADRIQLLAHGRDLMEWDHAEHQVLAGRSTTAAELPEKPFEGFYDYDWGMDRSLWDYFQTVWEHNRQLWDEQVGLELLPEGCYHRNRVVYIPKDSARQLLGNMEIAQNVILPIRNRICGNPVGYIRNRLAENITSGFYRAAGVGTDCVRISELNYVERKILSVYRWEVSKPEAILMDSPYWGMDLEDSDTFRRYLFHLTEKGIRVVYFSRSLQELQQYCKTVILTENGMCARCL